MKPVPGIRRTKSGWQVYLKRDGQFLSKHFPFDTPLPVLQTWRRQQKARAELKLAPVPADDETFAADCDRYLAAVRGMPTYDDRAYRITQWRNALGPNRRRADITSAEIRTQLEAWKADKKAHGTLNLYRTALMHLFTVLDGKAARNPIKDVPRYRETPQPLTLPTLADALNAIAAVKVTKGKTKGRARLLVLLWTGWPGAQLAKLQRADVDYKNSRAFVRGREKGRGTEGRWLPLLPQAVAAIRQLEAAKGFGKFSHSSLHSQLHAGCKLAHVKPFRVYDLRHLFLTVVATITKDDRVVAELAMHSDPRQTRRYTEGSVNPRVLDGLNQVALALKDR